MPEEDPGLLGNLPRSRPGKRSPKRAAAAPRPPAAGAPPRAAEPSSPPGPPGLDTAVRLGGLGLKLATELVRRLPRPPRP